MSYQGSELIEVLTRLKDYDQMDPEECLLALQEAGVLGLLGEKQQLMTYSFDGTMESVRDNHPTADEDELAEEHSQRFTGIIIGQYYENEEILSLGSDEIAEALFDTYESVGVEDELDLEDVLEGISSFQRAKENKQALESIAQASKPKLSEDLATPEQALAARQARYGRGM